MMSLGHRCHKLVFIYEYVWTQPSEKKTEIMSPTTDSALYKGTKGHLIFRCLFHVHVTSSKATRNDAVTVSGDIGSLTAGAAPRDNTSECIHHNRFVLSAFKMLCNFTGVFCYEQVMEVGSVWAGQSLRSPELRLSPSEMSSTPGRTPPFPSLKHTSLTKVCIQDRQTDRQTERQKDRKATSDQAAINGQYPLFYTQVWDSVLAQLTLNSSGRKWTEYKTVSLPTMQAVKVSQYHFGRGSAASFLESFSSISSLGMQTGKWVQKQGWLQT